MLTLEKEKLENVKLKIMLLGGKVINYGSAQDFAQIRHLDLNEKTPTLSLPCT